LKQVKRFKNIVLFVTLSTVIIVLWPLRNLLSIEEDIHTRRFCAYGQVFVEFEHTGKTWGTTFLDERGKPVSCTDDDVQHTVSNKEVI
jgi:hypothetical protein